MTEKNILQYRLEDGTIINIEGIDDSDGDLQRTSKKGDAFIEVDEKFETVLSKIQPVSELIFNSFKEFNSPDDIELEFGLKFGAKAGVIFASADSEATFKLTMKWNNQKDD